MSIMNRHKFLEKHSGPLVAAILVVVAIGGIIEIAPLFYVENTIEEVEGVRPYTPLELAGRGRQEIAVLDQPDGDGSGDAILNAADPDHGQPQRAALSAVVIRDRLLDHVSSSVTCGCSFKPPSEE